MSTDPAERVQRRVLLLVLLAFLPSVALYVYANGALRRTELAGHEEALLHAARGIAAHHDQNVQEATRLLATLAEVDAVRSLERGRCSELLARVLPHTPQFTTLSVIGGDGFLACGSITAGGDLYLGDRAYFTRATTENRPAVGDFALGRLTGKPGLGVAVPIATPSGLPGVVATTLDLTRIGTWAESVELPEDVSLTLLDRDGMVLVRRSNGPPPLEGDTLGTPAPPGFPPRPLNFTPLLLDGTDLDGTGRRFGVVALRGDGVEPVGYIAVGRRRDALNAEASRIFHTELALLGFAALAMLAAASVIAHFAFASHDRTQRGG
ncbi:MAG: hypothetical protein R3E98_03805 [Gemmatimonadota bacterium]|nr:hypothetical protein [Gemmatimonadota bacterium]